VTMLTLSMKILFFCYLLLLDLSLFSVAQFGRTETGNKIVFGRVEKPNSYGRIGKPVTLKISIFSLSNIENPWKTCTVAVWVRWTVWAAKRKLLGHASVGSCAHLWVIGCILDAFPRGADPFHGETECERFQIIRAPDQTFPPEFPDDAEILNE
jgi:hypothetical protein